MWQICGHIPQTLLALPDITCIAAQLSVSFFIETFIHAKEKVSVVSFKIALSLLESCFLMVVYVFFFKPANDGPVGGIADQTIQRQPGSVRMVPESHVRRTVVARSGPDTVSQSDGSADVPTFGDSRHSTVEVKLRSFVLIMYYSALPVSRDDSFLNQMESHLSR